MSDPGRGWQARIRIERPTAAEANRLSLALEPELARDVPRAGAALARPGPNVVELKVTAADTSACRAALNTYLSWLGLVLSTERAAQAPHG